MAPAMHSQQRKMGREAMARTECLENSGGETGIRMMACLMVSATCRKQITTSTEITTAARAALPRFAEESLW
jgi:hypothetical protein